MELLKVVDYEEITPSIDIDDSVEGVLKRVKPELRDWKKNTQYKIIEGKMSENIKKQFDLIMENREKYIQAFVAETGVFPTECEMVEEYVNESNFTGITMFFRRRSK